MQDFFNPAGLDVLDDGSGAVAFGLISKRVLYARFVGMLSTDLGATYAARVERLVASRAPLACFGDASGLRLHGSSAKARLLRFALAQCEWFPTFVLLTRKVRLAPWARFRAIGRAEALTVLSDPVEFELWLSNVAPSCISTDSPEPIALHRSGFESAPISGVRRASTSRRRASLGPPPGFQWPETRKTG